jgi:hypothetical protein
MAKLVRVNSTHEGAELYVNGRRAGVTPHDLELTGALAKKSALSIRISKRGYDRYSQQLVVAKADFEADGEKLIHDMTATLTKRAVVQVRRPRDTDDDPDDDPPKDTTPKDTTPKDTTPKDTTPKDTTPKDKPKDTTPKDTPKDTTPKDTPKDTTPKDKPPKDKPKSDDPVPDFMKE